MDSLDSVAARQFAVEVVQQLRDAGYEALWAGGCVRDQLLDKLPKDYDVATSAEPQQVRQVFGRRRTLALGAAFGVITVVGSKASGNVEVATFRRDATYSDGRHPDSVSYSTAENDALRRDFTINGLFYDPLGDQVIDYVGGQADLQRHTVRAIGNPHERFEEDKLRILRAIRFATVLEFTLEEATLAAVKHHAAELVIVSAERITAEVRKMLSARQRRRAVTLLAEAGLLQVIFPESSYLLPGTVQNAATHELVWNDMLATLDRLGEEVFPIALALLLRCMVPPDVTPAKYALEVGSRLKLSNDEVAVTKWLVENEPILSSVARRPWPEIQRLLIQPQAAYAPAYLNALASVEERLNTAAEFCAVRLSLPREELNPSPLLTGDDLIRMGLQPGRHFKGLLDTVRDRQLLGEIDSTAAAEIYVRQMTGT